MLRVNTTKSISSIDIPLKHLHFVSSRPPFLSSFSQTVTSKRPGYYIALYRYSLLLTGNQIAANEVFDNVIVKAAAKFSQMRCAYRANRWLFVHVRQEARAFILSQKQSEDRSTTSSTTPSFITSEEATLVEGFSHLPELNRSIYALFCFNIFTSSELAELFHIKLLDLGQILQQSRFLLQQAIPELPLLKINQEVTKRTNQEVTRRIGQEVTRRIGQEVTRRTSESIFQERLLSCCTPGCSSQKNKKLQTALRYQDTNPTLQAAFHQQLQFDAEVMRMCHGITIPEDLDMRFQHQWISAKQTHHSLKNVIRQPAFLAGVLSILFLVGWGIFAYIDRQKGFRGDEEVSQLITFILPAVPPQQKNTTATTGADNLTSRTLEFGDLKDILFLEQGLEHFTIPAAFSHYPIASYKVIEHNGEPIVFVVPKLPQDLCFIIFPSNPLGVKIKPHGHWKYLANERWNAVIHDSADHIGFVAVVYGSHDKLKGYLADVSVYP